MKRKVKKFKLDAILSVTTGRLVTVGNENGNGIENMYELMSWITGSHINDMGACANHELCTEFLINHFHEIALANNYMNELTVVLKSTGEQGIDLALMSWFQFLMERHPEIKWEYRVPQYTKTV